MSTPIGWDEVCACQHAAQLVFTADDVLGRVDKLGDLFTDLPITAEALPGT